MTPEFEIQGDYIVRYTHVDGLDAFTFKMETVMNKETFIEAYNRWIKGEENHVDQT